MLLKRINYNALQYFFPFCLMWLILCDFRLMLVGFGSCENGGFEFKAPTTHRNALRVLRAMQLPKPGMFLLHLGFLYSVSNLLL